MDFSQPFADENRKRPNIQLQLLQRLKLGGTRGNREGGDVLYAQRRRHETRLLIKFTKKNKKLEKGTRVKTYANIWQIIWKLRIIVH